LGTADEPPADEGDRARLEGELDALRRALAQEHSNAERLERRLETAASDPALVARLRERDALIEQLSAELRAARAGTE
jgi:hypothetical protein